MSWPWIVLLALALVVVVAVEWPRLSERFGSDARERNDRERRKEAFRVISSEEDDFVASVRRDLDELPTIEEHETGPNRLQ